MNDSTTKPSTPKRLTFRLSRKNNLLLESLANYLGKSKEETAKIALNAYLEHIKKGAKP